MTALTAERLAEIRADIDDMSSGHMAVLVLDLLDEVERLRTELQDTTWQDHADHWQVKALKAEEENIALRLERDALQKRLDSAEVYNNAVEEERKRIGKQLSDAKAEWAERCRRQEAGLRAALARAEKAEAALREIKGASRSSGDGLATQVGGPLNPTWVEWLMGYPPEDK